MGIFSFGKKKSEPVPSAGASGLAGRPDPQGKNNFIIVILDSCRYDSFMKANPKTIQRLGKVEKRWSYCSWTGPSHYNLLM